MPNSSKIVDRRQWLKWRKSGAVPQAPFDHITLVVDAVATFYSGPAKGHQTLTIIDGGKSVWTRLCAVVVPQRDFYTPGLVLKKLPGNAVHTHDFFES